MILIRFEIFDQISQFCLIFAILTFRIWSLLELHQVVGEKEKLFVVCAEVTSGVCNIKVMFLDRVMPYGFLVLLKIYLKRKSLKVNLN